MLKVAIASLVSPLVFPWIAWPVINSAFSALAYGKASWHWDFQNAALNAPLLFLHAYILMFIVFVPLVLFFRKMRWKAWWIYVTAGLISGLICFVPAASAPSVVTQPSLLWENLIYLIKEPGGFLNLFWVPQLQHYQLGTTVAAGVMMMCMWIVGVKGNPWFVEQSNPLLIRTRADDARAD